MAKVTISQESKLVKKADNYIIIIQKKNLGKLKGFMNRELSVEITLQTIEN